jgi:F-type H+-transporting ATPase subunit b
MIKFDKIQMIGYYAAGFFFLAWGSNASAVENAGDWRDTYDLVLMGINLGILAIILIRFGRKAIMNFLRKRELPDEIEEIANQKEKVLTGIQETFESMNESEIRFAQLKQKIADEGEKRKQEIISDAHEQSRIMLDAAKQRVENQICRAKENFKTELTDAVVRQAKERLPKI